MKKRSAKAIQKQRNKKDSFNKLKAVHTIIRVMLIVLLSITIILFIVTGF